MGIIKNQLKKNEEYRSPAAQLGKEGEKKRRVLTKHAGAGEEEEQEEEQEEEREKRKEAQQTE